MFIEKNKYRLYVTSFINDIDIPIKHTYHT